MKGLGRIFDIGSAFTPVDFNTADAATGHRVHLRNAQAIAFILYKGAGTAGADPVVTVQEHNAKTGGTSANLVVIDEFYSKSEATLDGDETWVRTAQTLAATANMGATSAEEEGIHVLRIRGVVAVCRVRMDQLQYRCHRRERAVGVLGCISCMV